MWTLSRSKREVESGNYKFQKLSNQRSSSSASSASNASSASSSSSSSSSKSSTSRRTELTVLASDAQPQQPPPAAQTEDLQGMPDQQQLILAGTDHEAIVSFAKAKEEFKRQMNFSGMIYRYLLSVSS